MAEWIGGLLSGAPGWLVLVAVIIIFIAGLSYYLAFYGNGDGYGHRSEWWKQQYRKKKKEQKRGKK